MMLASMTETARDIVRKLIAEEQRAADNADQLAAQRSRMGHKHGAEAYRRAAAHHGRRVNALRAVLERAERTITT